MDYSNLDLDFGSVKPLPQIPEGEYEMVIEDWNIVAPQKEETKSKGANLRVRLAFADPMWVDPQTGDVHDISNIKPNCQIFFMFDNPFSLVSIVCAVKNLDPSDPTVVGQVKIGDKSQWIGERVIARLVRTVADNGKKYLNPVPDAFLPVPF